MGRKVINGAGVDNTLAAQVYLNTHKTYLLADLYIIGESDDPRSLWLTDAEYPILYSWLGKVFQPAVISRGQVEAKIGFELQTLDITWNPGLQPNTANTKTASARQLAQQHVYDNWPIRIYRTIMPKPGDADSIGCMEWFGGRVNTVQVDRGPIVFNCNSYQDVLSQQVPAGVVEVTNTLAAYTAATKLPEDPSIPVFQCFPGSTQNHIYADCIRPTANKVYSGDKFVNGYMVFIDGPGATLTGAWAGIGGNGAFHDGNGNTHSAFSILGLLPYPPTPVADRFYVSAAAPINLDDEKYFGFPYVPSPQGAA